MPHATGAACHRQAPGTRSAATLGRVPHSGPDPSSRAPARARRGKLLRIAAACVVLLAVAAYLAARGVSGHGTPVCTVRASGSADGSPSYELKPVQAANAATIAAVASRRELPERAVTTALAAAIQESELRNVPHGDRDSVGLFQQRPSQGWGTVDQIRDPIYSTDRFYDHLVEIPDYSRLPLTVAAQRVQRSGYPEAYAKHETDATLLAAALTGRHPSALTCTSSGQEPAEPGDPERVRKRLTRDFGRDMLKDGAGKPSTSDAAEHGASPRAEAARSGAPPTVSVPAPGSREGWELAHWAIANAEGLRITQISYDGRVWSADRSTEGWRGEGAEDAKGSSADSPVQLRLAAGH